MKNFNQDDKFIEKPGMNVYGPGQHQPQDIVELVCRIVEEDGPRPMRNMRPAQKHRNAADQFSLEHHGAYEAYGRRSRDRLETVRLHNSGYPKMHDELNKRRSISKVTAINTQRLTTIQQAAYNKCNNYIKNKKKAEPTKRIALNCRSSNKRNTGSRQACSRSRVVKPKPQQARDKHSPCRLHRLSKLKINGFCQWSSRCLAIDKQSATADNNQLNLDDKMANEEGSFQCRNDCTVGRKPDCLSSTSSNDDSSKRNGTDASVTSYYSYTSLEHEPMDK